MYKMAQDIVKKITLSKLGLDKNVILEALKNASDSDVIPVAAFAGQITEAKARSADLGDYLLFEGDIVGINQLTGASLRSGALILPGVAETPLAGMVKRAIKVDAQGVVVSQGVVEFQFEITVRKDKNAIGYAYGLRSHGNATKEDAVLAMLAAMPMSKTASAVLTGEHAPKIEAPKNVKETAKAK
jgi:hypothetical protein